MVIKARRVLNSKTTRAAAAAVAVPASQVVSTEMSLSPCSQTDPIEEEEGDYRGETAEEERLLHRSKCSLFPRRTFLLLREVDGGGRRLHDVSV
jgi:hypothetical protein